MKLSTPKRGFRFPVQALVLVLILALVGAAFWYFVLADRTEPAVSLSPEAIMVSKHMRFSVHAQDEDSPLTRITVTATSQGQTFTLLDRILDAGDQATDASFTLEQLPLDSGEVILEVAVTDGSLANLGRGNTATMTRSCTLDTTPPQLFVQSLEHNLTQGGSGAIAFQSSEEVVNAGVTLRDSDIFFPAFKQPNGNWVCLFAFPYFMGPSDFHPVLTAQDTAGNPTQEEFYYTASPADFRQRTIEITDSFLERKVPEFPEFAASAPNFVDAYVRINNELRDENQETLYSVATETAPTPEWSGAFSRMDKTESTAFFGDQRTYVYNGEVIDFQVHLGYDLASVQHDDVTASNNGTVVFAQELGIYGRSVVIDHGMGLQSLYSHLSAIAVQPGQFVEQGQVVGQSGMTGLAGGDHLHFGILLGGIAVNPLEWWDGMWVERNIANRFQ